MRVAGGRRARGSREADPCERRRPPRPLVPAPADRRGDCASLASMPSAPPVRLALRLVLSAGLVALAGVSLARYVTGVGVRSSGTPVVVAFGDSLTEGSGLLARPWPSVLAGRLGGRKGSGP